MTNRFRVAVNGDQAAVIRLPKKFKFKFVSKHAEVQQLPAKDFLLLRWHLWQSVSFCLRSQKHLWRVSILCLLAEPPPPHVPLSLMPPCAKPWAGGQTRSCVPPSISCPTASGRVWLQDTTESVRKTLHCFWRSVFSLFWDFVQVSVEKSESVHHVFHADLLSLNYFNPGSFILDFLWNSVNLLLLLHSCLPQYFCPSTFPSFIHLKPETWKSRK